MEGTDRGREEKADHVKLRNRYKNSAYVVVVSIAIIGILVTYIVLGKLNSFSLLDFVQDMAGNLMGIFAGFLVFDIIHDKMTKDTYAEEVSEQLLETLLSKEDAMQALDVNLRKKFINNAIKSLDDDPKAAEEIVQKITRYLNHEEERSRILEIIDTYSEAQKRLFVENNVDLIVNDEDAADMIKNYLKHYMLGNNDCRIRTNFSYSFELRDTLPDVFECLIHKDEYFYVQETLTYEVKYLIPEMNNVDSSIIRIGFAYDNRNLDKFLRDSQKNQAGDPINNCIFRESLDIDQEDIQFFESLSPEELKKIFSKMFRPHLTIDRSSGELIQVTATDYGIVAEFKMEHDQTAQKHTIDIIFHMPKRWGGILEVALVEPTKHPKISLSYQEDSMEVEMYSFLDKGEDSAYENTHENENGVYRILLNNEWVYPVSGVIFTINKLKK